MPIDLQTIATGILAALAPASAFAVWALKMSWTVAKRDSALQEATEETHKEIADLRSDLHGFRDRSYRRIDEAHEAVGDIRSQVNAWQLEIVRTYATKSEMDKLADRMASGFARIDEKLDRILAQGVR